MTVEEIRERLFALQDIKYRDFQSKLIPQIESEAVIGVRTPELRKLAKELYQKEDIPDFLSELPHRYFDENQLHAFIVSLYKDYAACMEEVERFLPYVDNWATCDQMSPKIFKKHRAELLVKIAEWIRSEHTYTIRFGTGMLMEHFLDADFETEFEAAELTGRKLMDMVAGIRSEEYYVNMMTAWYFATALAKQYEAALPYIEDGRLDRWTHNKTIQKAVESYRVSDERKSYLRTLRK